MRSIAALACLGVWLGIVVYDALTATYDMPQALFALGPALLAYILGVQWKRNGAKRNGTPPLLGNGTG